MLAKVTVMGTALALEGTDRLLRTVDQGEQRSDHGRAHQRSGLPLSHQDGTPGKAAVAHYLLKGSTHLALATDATIRT